ncbi:AVAST type 1 anti-phage system MBL fold metallo-hydrolase Avs1a [Bremerella sp. JC817]|uniref:AVAST type 1 anti-phage system MBL fold metallo-hydrolase Avs1a n=1 Tax=Bremerella sp. JC817 TaxID=3231756 RepID=UPI00345B1C0A
MVGKTTLTMFSAGAGDSFLVEHDSSESLSILVDGGYAQTFRKMLLPLLRQEYQKLRHIDLLITTHIDADHIGGILAFLKQNGNVDTPSIAPVRFAWHNSLRSLGGLNGGEGQLGTADLAVLSQVRQRGFLEREESSPSEISAMQGSSLASLLQQNGYSWNESRPIVKGIKYEVAPNCEIHVISPPVERLVELRSYWIRKFRELGFAGIISKSEVFEDAFEFMCSFESVDENVSEEISSIDENAATLSDVYTPDDAITNGSSIAFVLAMGMTRILFLGDCWAEDAVSGISDEFSESFPIIFDAIKVSHHGSVRNTSPKLLSMIDSPRFLISTSGEQHGHPSLAVLKEIVDRPASFKRTLYFNYESRASEMISNYQRNSGSEFDVVVSNNPRIVIEK